MIVSKLGVKKPNRCFLPRQHKNRWPGTGHRFFVSRARRNVVATFVEGPPGITKERPSTTIAQWLHDGRVRPNFDLSLKFSSASGNRESPWVFRQATGPVTGVSQCSEPARDPQTGVEVPSVAS